MDAELIVERADATKEHMWLTAWEICLKVKNRNAKYSSVVKVRRYICIH